MPRARKSEPNPVSDAVRKLRECLGQTQQAFAHSLGVAITTVARWETTRPPKGKTLADLSRLASENNQPELAQVFDGALEAELGTSANLAQRALLNAEKLFAEDMLRRLELIRRDDQAKAAEIIDYVHAELTKLRKRMDISIAPAFFGDEQKVSIRALRHKAKFFREHLEKQHELWPRFLQLMLDGKTKAEACRELGIPEGLFKVTEEISGQGTVRRDVLHLPGGGTRLIEVTVTDGSPPAASEEPQGTAEGEEWSVPK